MAKRTRQTKPAARIGLLLWAASTCSPQARAQDQGASSSDAAQSAGEQSAGEQSAGEWRLDGQIVRLDAARSAFWIEPEVTVLGNEATLDGSDRARRVTVDASTLVWTPDGVTRPFGFNALDQAVRAQSEITVVGTRESTSHGPILRARLLVLPDLLPRGWRPRPFGASPRRSTPLASAAPTSSSASSSAARLAAARAAAQHSAAAQEAARAASARSSKAQAQLAQQRLEQQRLEQAKIAQAQLEKEQLAKHQLAEEQLEQARHAQAQLAQERLEQQRLAQAQLAQAQQERLAKAQAQLAQAQLARKQQALAQARLEQQRQAQAQLAQAQQAQERLEQQQLEQARIAQARQAQAQAQQAQERLEQQQLEQARIAQARQAQAQAQERLAQAQERLAQAQAQERPAQRRQAQARLAAASRARLAAQRPTLSTARASDSAIDSATVLRAAHGAGAAALAPRDSKPPLLASSLPSSGAAPSAPRVAAAALGGEGQVTLSVGPGTQQASGELSRGHTLQAHVGAALPSAAPRDVERERLRAAPPRTSRQDAPSSWDAAPLASRNENAPAASPRGSQTGRLAMRATLPASPERRLVAPPLLSAPLGPASTLAPAAPPSLAPGSAQVLAPAGGLANGASAGGSGAASGLDAVQVLAQGEQRAAQARENFAGLRALQDQVKWLDFCAGPGWDSRRALSANALSTNALSASATAANATAAGTTAVSATVSGVASGVQNEGVKMVALTFDDGPHANTARILDILDANGAKATFFLVGRNVQKNPAMVREIARRGHDIGSHSFHHFQGVRLSLSQWQQEVDDNNQVIGAILGVAPRWFRAPGCHYSDEALQALRSRGMVRVDSSNNSGDWHEPSPDKIVAGVLSRLAPGQILLFHDPLPQTARALPVLLRELASRGYKCVTLTELARASAQDTTFTPPLCPPGQGIILPPSAFAARSRTTGQALEAPSEPSSLPSDAPVLLQVQP